MLYGIYVRLLGPAPANSVWGADLMWQWMTKNCLPAQGW